jgi:hypothetical protein
MRILLLVISVLIELKIASRVSFYSSLKLAVDFEFSIIALGSVVSAKTTSTLLANSA